MKSRIGVPVLTLLVIASHLMAQSRRNVPAEHGLDSGSSSSGSSSASTYHWTNVAIVGGGYVPAILFHPIKPGLAFARTDIGGAYRRNAATRMWVPIMDGGSSSPNWWYASPEAIGVDPKNPN